MEWTVMYKRGSDNEQVTQLAASEAAARSNYAKLTAKAHPDSPLWVELRRDGAPVERWSK